MILNLVDVGQSWLADGFPPSSSFIENGEQTQGWDCCHVPNLVTDDIVVELLAYTSYTCQPVDFGLLGGLHPQFVTGN